MDVAMLGGYAYAKWLDPGESPMFNFDFLLWSLLKYGAIVGAVGGIVGPLLINGKVPKRFWG